MELFGFKIERITPEELVTQEKAHQLLGDKSEGGHMPIEHAIAAHRNPIWDKIVWPDDTHLTPMKKLGLKNRQLKWLECRFFSICIFRELESLGAFTYTEKTRAIVEELQALHCMRYRHMPPDVLLQLPGLMSTVFQGDRLIPTPNTDNPVGSNLLDFNRK